MEILNLNEFKKEFKKIQLGEKIYKVPKGIPELLYLELIEATNEPMKIGMRKTLEVLHKIFQIYQPKMTLKELGMITSEQKTAIINYIMADMSIEDTKKALEEAKEMLKDGKKKPPQAES